MPNLGCVHWTGVFGYLSLVVVAILLLSRWLGWTSWISSSQ
jgi:hypothetical protein